MLYLNEAKSSAIDRRTRQTEIHVDKIQSQNTRIESQNGRIESQNDRLESKLDRLLLAQGQR